MDLSIILRDWPYDEQDENNNVRIVPGIDGRLKIQIRLRHGVVQWEADGRPDGKRPFGCEDVLSYCATRMGATGQGACAESGSDFRLERGLVSALADEMRQFEERAVAFNTLGDFARARRDIRHNLGILDVVQHCCPQQEDSAEFERHRPRLLMNEARSAASLHMQRDEAQEAVDALNDGIRRIEEFLSPRDADGRQQQCQEKQILIDFRRSIRERYDVPLTDKELLDTLKAEQEVAIEEEDYELAARLRDKINTVLARLNRGDEVYH